AQLICSPRSQAYATFSCDSRNMKERPDMKPFNDDHCSDKFDSSTTTCISHAAIRALDDSIRCEVAIRSAASLEEKAKHHGRMDLSSRDE
ncbi:hypothetical protein Dimus_031861, partial [Dionaea muscipula]